MEGKVIKTDFPCTGTVLTEEGEVSVKNVIPGQRVSVRVLKKRHGKASGQLLEVIEASPDEIKPACLHFDPVSGCGGCIYQNLPYDKQLDLKKGQVKELICKVYNGSAEFDDIFEGIQQSPDQFGFRNKMEFSFGDEYKDGPLALGMHKRGGFYDIVTVDDCRIIDEDFRKIIRTVLDFATARGLSFYHRVKHTGYLRHLLVRKGLSTGQILIALVTSSASMLSDDPEAEEGSVLQNAADEDRLLEEVTDVLKQLDSDCLKGEITGIIHIKNDSVADVVKCEEMTVLSGRDWFYEKLLGLTFRITPFSFFQTNTKGAEVLYETVRDFCLGCMDNNADKPVIFDLYSGTGTIAQIMAPVAKKVVGVEIVKEAVEAAKENSRMNGLDNCEFTAGDVLKVIDEIEDKPDLIILDPPRDGIHPKALPKILAYGVKNIVYISCKPTSLARDLEIMQEAGYELRRIKCVDMFPASGNVETIVKLVNMGVKPDFTVHLEVDVDEFYEKVGEDKRHFREQRERNKKKGGSQE